MHIQRIRGGSDSKVNNEQIYYCIENTGNENPNNEGKHQYLNDEFGVNCKFCFLPKDKANYKPMKLLDNGKFQFIEVEQ